MNHLILAFGPGPVISDEGLSLLELASDFPLMSNLPRIACHEFSNELLILILY